jgi:hypothetical protein
MSGATRTTEGMPNKIILSVNPSLIFYL